MDSFEMTKIAGSVLAALLLIFGAKTIIDMNVGHGGEKPGYSLPGFEPAAKVEKAEAAAKPDTPAKEAAPATAPAAKPAETKATEAPKDATAKDAAAAPAAGGGDEVLTLLAKASADNGKAVFGKCKSCHVNEKGKASSVGPNLWGVVNRAKGSYEGFKYSEGMLAKGGNWTFADLSAFIRNPKGYVPATKMVFNGIASPADEADLIAYLATLADTPVALPK
jgi:cytochrome c